MNKTKNEIEDVFEGEVIQIWKDEDYVSISFPYCVVNIPNELWPEIKKDFDKLAEI